MDSKYWRLPSCYVVEQHRSSTVKGDPEEFKRISQLEGTLTTGLTQYRQSYPLMLALKSHVTVVLRP